MRSGPHNASVARTCRSTTIIASAAGVCCAREDISSCSAFNAKRHPKPKPPQPTKCPQKQNHPTATQAQRHSHPQTTQPPQSKSPNRTHAPKRSHPQSAERPPTQNHPSRGWISPARLSVTSFQKKHKLTLGAFIRSRTKNLYCVGQKNKKRAPRPATRSNNSSVRLGR